MLIWSGRSLRISTQGFGDTANAVTATTGQSKSPSAQTDQLRDANASPNPDASVARQALAKAALLGFVHY